MTNKTYDILKWVAQIVLPAVATLYFALSSIWGLPYGEQIVGTISAIDAFLGAILKYSYDHYEGDGQLIIDTSDPLKDIYSLAIEDYPNKFEEKDTFVLKVRRPAHMSDISEE